MERNMDCIYEDVCTVECEKSCIRYLEMDYLLQHSGIPKARQHRYRLQPEKCDLRAFKRLANIQKDIVNFTAGDNSLYLWSNNCGNGKTTWSIKLLLQYFNEVWLGNGFKPRGLFINVPTFLSKCKEVMSYPDDRFERLRKLIPEVDLVVFDDMITMHLSTYDYNTLLNYVDQRVFNCKSTIYTGNGNPKILSQAVGDRLASRISKGYIIELKGLDRRHDSITDNQ